MPHGFEKEEATDVGVLPPLFEGEHKHTSFGDAFDAMEDKDATFFLFAQEGRVPRSVFARHCAYGCFFFEEDIVASFEREIASKNDCGHNVHLWMFIQIVESKPLERQVWMSIAL